MLVVMLMAILLLLRADGGLGYTTKKWLKSNQRTILLTGVAGNHAGHYSSNEEVSAVVETLQKLVMFNGMNESNMIQFIRDKILILGNTLKTKKGLFYPSDITHLYWCIEKFCQIDSIATNLLRDSKVCNAIEYIDSVNDELQLPFKVLHQLLHGSNDITINSLLREIPFKNDNLKSKDGKIFTERRKTCWMVEEHSNIGGLAYSGKIMPPGTHSLTHFMVDLLTSLLTQYQCHPQLRLLMI